MVKGPGTPFSSGVRTFDPTWAGDLSVDDGAALLEGGGRCGVGVSVQRCRAGADAAAPCLLQNQP